MCGGGGGGFFIESMGPELGQVPFFVAGQSQHFKQLLWKNGGTEIPLRRALAAGYY